jgi:hypothetical protein
VRAFRLPHALRIGRQFSEFLGISNTLLSLRFGILSLLRLILLAFLMLILHVVGLTERALLRLVIFLDLLSFVGLLESSIWIVHNMRDFGVRFERVSLMCDNTSVISVTKNLVFHKKMRYVERRHNFLRDHVEKGDIEMRYIDSERRLFDIFTKPLDASRFADLRGEIGVCHPYDLV